MTTALAVRETPHSNRPPVEKLRAAMYRIIDELSMARSEPDAVLQELKEEFDELWKQVTSAGPTIH